jgi:nitrogen regulatory protein P-II 2
VHLVTAIVKPFKLEDVRQALDAGNVRGLTVTEVRGLGATPDTDGRFVDDGFVVDFPVRIRIDLVVTDDSLDSVMETISVSARTGNHDGKIYATQLDQVIRIRTGETGPEAV